MNGMQFTSNMITVLVWPVVILVLLVVYRRWITSTVSALTEGVRVSKLKIGPSEWSFTVDKAGQNVAMALARMPEPVSDGPVPTTLVDLIGDVNNNPHAGMRTAFYLVRQALGEFYPQLASVPPDQLSRATKDLARQGMLSTEVEWAVGQLYQLLEMSESDPGKTDPKQGYEFLMLAEGAIHAIVRSAAAQAGDERGAISAGSRLEPIRPSWQGRYDNRFRIQLRIQNWTGSQFSGVMRYTDSGTVTRIEGDIKAASPGDTGITVIWKETGYDYESASGSTSTASIRRPCTATR